MSYLDTVYHFLKTSISNGGTDSLDEVYEFARTNRDLEIKSPAILAMICWGEVGFEKIKSLAVEYPSSKNTSAAMKIFSIISAEVEIDNHLLFIHDEGFRKIVNSYVQNQDHKKTAQQKLGELIQSFSTDDLLIPLGVALTQLSFSKDDLSKELILAVSTKWLQFGPSALLEYEDLIKHNANDEPAFQKFFIEYPQFLDPLAVEVWSQPDLHGALEPDFVIRRADNSYLVIEIECPGKKLMTLANQLAAPATHAEKQVTEYKNFLLERFPEAQKNFPFFNSPDCLAVIGLERNLSVNQRKALTFTNEHRSNLKTVGFDWLANRAETLIKNVSSGGIKVIQKHRMK